jgi:glycosyltransferase involved in cell wall biosynthesis
MKKKILFIYTNYSTFVKTDFEILASEHEVSKYQFKPVKGLLNTAWQMFRQLFYLLLNIRKFDAVFIWFADYHSLLPVLFAKILGKKSFVVIGGYDICRVRSLNYGVFTSKFRSIFAFYSMKYCFLNLTVSKYVDRRLKWILPDSNREMIYNSVRLKNENINTDKKKLVLTVGQINNRQTFFRKGIDTFVEVARKRPDYDFIVVGIDQNNFKDLLRDTPANLVLFNKIEQQDLIKYYSKAKYYAQFSRMDTFCLTLAESMLFGCYPIITNEGGMPEVIGKHGKIVKRDSSEVASIIENTIISIETNHNIIDHVSNNFSPKIREQLILKLISKNFNSTNT